MFKNFLVAFIISNSIILLANSMDAPRIIQRIEDEKEIYIKEKLRYIIVGEHDKRSNKYHVAKHWDADHVTQKENHYRAFKKLQSNFLNGKHDEPSIDNNITED